MNTRYPSRLTIWLLPLLLFGLACGATSLPTASQPTQTNPPPPQPTAALPGASGTPMVVVATPQSGITVSEAYMTTSNLASFVGSDTKPSATAFESGLEQLFVIVVFCPPNQSGVTLEATVSGPDGHVDLGEYASFMRVAYPPDCETISLAVEPQSGTFQDGSYQTTLILDSEPIVVLDWSVGRPQ